MACARDGPEEDETIVRRSGGVAAGAIAASASARGLVGAPRRPRRRRGDGLFGLHDGLVGFNDDLVGRRHDGLFGRRRLGDAVGDAVAHCRRGGVEVGDHLPGVLVRRPDGGGRGLGLRAGAALELELVGQARGAAVELGDAVEQTALALGLGDAGAQPGELGLVGLAGRALGVEVRAEGGEDGAVGLARRLHLRAQLGGDVLAGRLAAGLHVRAQRLELLPHLGERGSLGGEVVAEGGQRRLVGLPRGALALELVLQRLELSRVGRTFERFSGTPLDVQLGVERGERGGLGIERVAERAARRPLPIERVLEARPRDPLCAQVGHRGRSLAARGLGLRTGGGPRRAFGLQVRAQVPELVARVFELRARLREIGRGGPSLVCRRGTFVRQRGLSRLDALVRGGPRRSDLDFGGALRLGDLRLGGAKRLANLSFSGGLRLGDLALPRSTEPKQPPPQRQL